MNQNQDLEKLVQEVYKEIDDINDAQKMTYNLTIGDLKATLERVMGFIDYCKFEFGENVTER